MKTQYRILPVTGYYHGQYLQFLSVESTNWLQRLLGRHVKEVWRFIPKEKFAVTAKRCLEQSTCPRRVLEFDCIGAYYGDIKELIEFTEKYPDIQDYFSMLNCKVWDRRIINL